MRINFNRVICCVLLSSCLALNAHAYHSNLLRGRVGYLDLKDSISAGSGGAAGNQKITDAKTLELAFAKFFTTNIAAELGVGYFFLHTKRNDAIKKKDTNIIPIYGTLQFHLPIINKFTPYVGVGYSYNIFEHTSSELEIRKGGGLIYQAGIDFFPNNQWGINFDFKYSRIKHTIIDNNQDFKAKLRNFSSMVGVVLSL